MKKPKPPAPARSQKKEPPAPEKWEGYDLVRDERGRRLLKPKYKPLSFSSDTETEVLINERAAALGLSRSAYINALIREDLIRRGALTVQATQGQQLPARVAMKYTRRKAAAPD